jgi:hypothetical protein
VRFPGSVASRVNIEKNIPLSTQIHASIRAELDQAVARLEAASARELTARHSLPPSDGRFHAILTERDAARQAVKTLRESEDLAARQMNYWKDLKPVDDELAIAIAARDAAKSRYNSGFSFTVSAPDHLANTRALLEAEARMRALDGKWNDVALKAMTRDFSTPSVVRPPEGGVSPFAQSLGGMSGVGSSLPPPPLGQF